MLFTKKPTALAVALALSSMWQSAVAQSNPTPEPSQVMNEVIINSSKIDIAQPNSSSLDAAILAPMRAAGSDTANLLQNIPGLSLYGAGGVSSLPVIHGMADDRMRIKVDGMDLISACANHMNPPLSYIDPTNVGSIKVFAGITPVSAGGDSIGGAIRSILQRRNLPSPGEAPCSKARPARFIAATGSQRRQCVDDGGKRKSERDATAVPRLKRATTRRRKTSSRGRAIALVTRAFWRRRSRLLQLQIGKPVDRRRHAP